MDLDEGFDVAGSNPWRGTAQMGNAMTCDFRAKRS
jgi:hypothetical protein